MKDKNYMIISIDTEKAFDKIQHPLMVKTVNKISIAGTYLSSMAIYWQAYSWHHTWWWKAESFPFMSGTRPGYSILPLLFNIVWKVLARAVRQEKEMHPDMKRKK